MVWLIHKLSLYTITISLSSIKQAFRKDTIIPSYHELRQHNQLKCFGNCNSAKCHFQIPPSFFFFYESKCTEQHHN